MPNVDPIITGISIQPLRQKYLTFVPGMKWRANVYVWYHFYAFPDRLCFGSYKRCCHAGYWNPRRSSIVCLASPLAMRSSLGSTRINHARQYSRRSRSPILADTRKSRKCHWFEWENRRSVSTARSRLGRANQLLLPLCALRATTLNEVVVDIVEARFYPYEHTFAKYKLLFS